MTKELVVLVLCDKQTSNSEKADIVKALLEADHPQSFLAMKTLFIVDLHDLPHDLPKLVDFVGPRSSLIFDFLDIDVQWMTTDSNTWMENQEYVRFFNIANSMVCVDNSAERNVQNVCKYAKYSKDLA